MRIECIPGCEGIPAAVPCTSNSPYGLVGCNPIVCRSNADPPLCNAGGHPGGAGFVSACEADVGCEHGNGVCSPVSVAAYSVTAEAGLDLTSAGFDVTVTCSAGYDDLGGPGVSATACTTSGAYSLSGCAPIVCTTPADLTGYTITAEANLDMSAGPLDVSFGPCTTGYGLVQLWEGSVGGTTATACMADGEYIVSGCMICQPGFYSIVHASSGQRYCDNCDAGTFLPGTGNTLNADGTSPCTDCDTGRFSSVMRAAIVTGESILAGAGQCSDCAPGQYQPTQGQSGCIDCSSGQSQPLSGQIECQPCAVDTYSLDGAANCSTCSSGIDAGYLTPFWVPEILGTTARCAPQLCTRGLSLLYSQSVCSGRTGDLCDFTCIPGYQASGVHRCSPEGAFVGGQCAPERCTGTIPNSVTACVGAIGEACSYTCACGHYTTGSHICSQGGPGMANFSGGSCNPCAAGRASLGSTCETCGSGQEPTPDGCSCVPCGDSRAGVIGVCSSCGPGTAPSADLSTCLACLAGYISDGSLCTQCAQNEYTLDNVACVQADDGMEPNADQADQIACQEGWAGVSGVCNPCEAGSVSSVARTSCDPCPRFRFSSDGITCKQCLSGSVPNSQVTATMCVSCTLESSAEAEAGSYAATDWQGCSTVMVVCSPGEQLNQLETACILCSDIADNLFSSGGYLCEACPPGHSPAATRDRCQPCPAGTAGTTGTCTLCSDRGNSDALFSVAGSSRCTSCRAGTEPTADRTGCVECADGMFSPYGSCRPCTAGTESNTLRSACSSCVAAGEGQVSPDGRACSSCPMNTMAAADRASCEPCSANQIGIGGVCAPACDLLGCQNETLTNQGGNSTVGLHMLCPSFAGWLDDEHTSSKSLSLAAGSGSISCSSADPCKYDLPVGVTPIEVVATLGTNSAMCALQMTVRAARIAVAPSQVEMETLGTATASAPLTITNEGEETVVVLDVALDAAYVELARVRDMYGVQLEFPASVMPGQSLIAMLNGLGPSVPAGSYLVNGTVTSSIGTENFAVRFNVQAVQLQIITLPSVLPTARLRAGEAGASTFFSIYNVDATEAMDWVIQNCTTISDATAAFAIRGESPSAVTFSECASTAQVDVGEQASVRVMYYAPTAVVDYAEIPVTIVRSDAVGKVPASSWNVLASLQITANVVLAAQCSAGIDATLVVAGQPGAIRVIPRDEFGNGISSFGLEFEAQAEHVRVGSTTTTVLTFRSTFDFVAQAYYVPFTLPQQGSFTVTVLLGGATVETIVVDVQSVTCDSVSSPSASGATCVCNTGYARQEAGDCGRCQPGFEPQQNPEMGCESCILKSGTISVAGIMCEQCLSGRPSEDVDACEPCPDEQYYDATANVCKNCLAGERLNTLEFNAAPCVPCGPGAAGVGGICQVCDNGKQPNVELTVCEICPVGYAGVDGLCNICPPGTQQSEDQTSCLPCPAGTYRDTELLPLCIDCPQRLDGTHGMISEQGSNTIDDCRCPRAYYDRIDESGNDAPVVCYVEGMSTRNVLNFPSNKLSSVDFRTRKRCLKCPDCLTCDFDDYSGIPFVAEGFTVVSVSKDRGWPGALAMGQQKGLPAPEVHTTSSAAITHQRQVFACPTGGACRSEQEYRNVTLADSIVPCSAGYDGTVCGFCLDGYSMGKDGCKACAPIGWAALAFIALVLFSRGVGWWMAQRKKKPTQPSNAVVVVKILGKILPELLSDVKVFIGVYQTMANMGSSLSLKFPFSVEAYLDQVRSFVNADMFSVPAVGCIIGGNFYAKLWASLLAPGFALGAFWVLYNRKLKKIYLNRVPADPEQDEQAKQYLVMQHTKRRQSKSDKNDEFHDEDRMSHRRHKTTEDEKVGDHVEQTFPDSQEFRQRVRVQERKEELQNDMLSKAFFIAFLAYPPCVDKIFAMFYCFQMDVNHAFLNADFSIDCTTATYTFHFGMCLLLVVLIPLGFPLFFGAWIWRSRMAIANHEGPVHIENLYQDYKPEHPLWEIFQMLQKVVLIGLLSFVERGSILQCLVGLVVTNCVLLALVRAQPYQKFQTNVLVILGQAIIVMSYLSALLMRVNLDSESFTVDTIGSVIILANVPIVFYLVIDTYKTVKDQMMSAQIDLLASELGGASGRYLCKKDVDITDKLKLSKKKESDKLVGSVVAGEEVVAVGQGFTEQGNARIQLKDGWVSFSDGGLIGKRNFVLLPSDTQEKAGKLKFKVERDGSKLVATVKQASGLKDMDGMFGHVLTAVHLKDHGKNDVYVTVEVNGQRRSTSTIVDAGAKATWQDGGEALEFDLTGDELSSIVLECYDQDYAADNQADSSDFIGGLVFPLEPFNGAPTWEWDGSRVIRDKKPEAGAPSPSKSMATFENEETYMYNPLNSSLQSFDDRGASPDDDGMDGSAGPAVEAPSSGSWDVEAAPVGTTAGSAEEGDVEEV